MKCLEDAVVVALAVRAHHEWDRNACWASERYEQARWNSKQALPVVVVADGTARVKAVDGGNRDSAKESDEETRGSKRADATVAAIMTMMKGKKEGGGPWVMGH